MELGLKGRVALITGGGKGLGRATAEALAAEGVRLALTGHSDPQLLEATVEELRGGGAEVLGLIGDVRQISEVHRFVEETVRTYSQLDILVTNAGVTGPRLDTGRMIETTEEQWAEVVDSHLKGTFFSIQYAARHMIRRGWGRIIAISSIHGRTGGREGLAAYGAAKAGVIALVSTAARELGPHGITANAIAPGFMRTESLERNLPPDWVPKIAKQIPLQRLGRPKEIGEAVVFLASEAAGFVNGAVLDINGGRTEYVFS